jgi:hypothetical protein
VNVGNSTADAGGLSYSVTPAPGTSVGVEYVGANPTLGNIYLDPRATTTFTLWFQVTSGTTGTVAIVCDILVSAVG